LLEVAEIAARLQARLTTLNQELARHEGAREAIAATLAEAEERVTATGDEAEILRTVLDRLQGMEQVWQRKFQKSTEAIVSEGLSHVFGEELQLQIRPSTKADMSAVEFVLIKDGQEEDVMTGQGGGYIGIIAFLLRVLLIMASRPLLRLVLVLDEPFAHLSIEFRHPLAEMMAALIDRLGFQLLMVTQEPEYVDAADAAYRFRVARAVTEVEVLKNPGEGKNQTDA
jgi:DNA repair exonuclease SbcCD ATPase subunit